VRREEDEKGGIVNIQAEQSAVANRVAMTAFRDTTPNLAALLLSWIVRRRKPA